jgi:hypothetical protein
LADAGVAEAVVVGGVFKMYDFKAKIICNINIRFVRLGETGKMKFERFWSAKATPRSTSTKMWQGGFDVLPSEVAWKISVKIAQSYGSPQIPGRVGRCPT